MTIRPATISIASTVTGAPGAARWCRAACATAHSSTSNAELLSAELARHEPGDGERRAGARQQSEYEGEQHTPAPATAPRRRRERVMGDQRRVAFEQALAFDQPARHVFGHRIHEVGDLARLGEHAAAIARVLQEAVDALVAPHRHVGDHVDPQTRRIARHQPAVEQVDIGRELGEHRIERLVQQLEPRGLGVAHVDDDGGALRDLDTRLAHRLPEPRWRARRRSRIGFVFHRAFGLGHDASVTDPRTGLQAQPPSASGKNMSFQSAGGVFRVPTLAMKLTNDWMPPTLVVYWIAGSARTSMISSTGVRSLVIFR